MLSSLIYSQIPLAAWVTRQLSPSGQRINDSTKNRRTEIALSLHKREIRAPSHICRLLEVHPLRSLPGWYFIVDNREVITLNEPQVWTLIGVFSAAIFGVLTIGVSALRSEMRALRNELLTKMDAGFKSVNKRIDYLNRDVQYLMRREFGDSPNQ